MRWRQVWPASCLGAVLAAMLVGGPSAHSQSPVDAARQEGSVVVYGSLESETMDAVKAAFTRKYGVAVEYWRGSSSKVLDRVLTESRTGKPAFDVALTNRGPMLVLKQQGAFAPYVSPQTANFAGAMKDPENVLSPTYRIVIVGILYNTRLLRPGEVPKSLEDFLAPAWRGK